MKKYLFTMVVMAVFAIGFAASDEETSSSEPQKQESPAEKKAREKREKEDMVKRMMNDAYSYGVSQGEQFTHYQECDGYFRKRWFTPSTDEEFELFRKYKEEYNRGWDEGQRTKEKMRNM